MSEKYYLVQATDDEIRENGENGGAVTALYQYLLSKEIVEGVLTLKSGDDIYDGIPAFIDNVEDLKQTSGSLHTAPTMVGDLIEKHFKGRKVAVSVKPCDTRAMKELTIRHRINRDDLYMIGLNCGGTVSPMTARNMIETYYDVNPSDVISEEIDKGKFIIELKDGSEKAVKIDDLEAEGAGRRLNCQRCSVKIPRGADVACGNWGSEPGWTFVEINTPKGEELIRNAKAEGFIETKNPNEKQLEMRSKVENIMLKMGEKTKETQFKAVLPANVWDRCIKCFACRDICPVCWCNECELEKDYLKEDASKGVNTLTYQGIRLSHMAFSCCDCGQCEDVCPMEIPVAFLFDKMQKKYKDETGYFAGVSDGKPPLYSGEKI